MPNEWSAVSAEDPDFTALLTESYLHVVGHPLVGLDVPPTDIPRWLYRDAPFALLAHRPETDPRFCYANLTAQRYFGYDWDEFVGLPSRLSAASPDRAERARLLDEVTRHGFSNDYRGLRISKSGARFWIEQATVWNLVDHHGRLHGQAATFESVTPA